LKFSGGTKVNKVNKNGIEYYTIDHMEDIQNQMLRLLKIVDSICRDNDLKYFLDGGTAIGAYRHGGFIPWDDDLDIGMLKSDYLKLIDILKGMDKSKYFLFDYDQNMHCSSFFGERCRFFASFDEKKRHIYPIKIDIRPLNIIEDSEESINKNRIFRELANYIIFNKCDQKYASEALKLYENEFDNVSKNFMHFYNFEYGLYSDTKSSALVHPYMEYSTSKTYRYNDIFPLNQINFSGLDTFVPATDSLLTEIYDDYMKLPEIEVRRPQAVRVFYSSNYDKLYDYLIDKNSKSILQRFIFTIKTGLLCK